MKKSTLIMILSLVLAVAIGIGSTMAYLQDTDEDVNVMTLGNVYIEQHEYERVQNEDGEYEMVTSEKYGGEGYKLQEFTQGKPLYPAVGAVNDYGEYVYFDQLGEGASGGQAVLDGIQNAQDKFVLVENTGKSDAYVRTIFAFEMGTMDYQRWDEIFMTSVASFNNNGDMPWKYTDIGSAVIDGNTYFLVEAVYTGGDSRHVDGVLPAGEYTYASLAQVYLKSEANNEDMVALDGNQNGTYDILVVSQAVQTQGFADAKTALDTAFGPITVDNNPWKKDGKDLDGTPVFPSAAGTAEELKAALAAGGEVYLTGDIDMGSEILTIAKDTTIDLKGYELSGETGTSQGHLIMVKHGATLNIKDSSADESGKLTYDAASSNVGWTIDVEGDLNLYSGTIELTGDWSIGYGVDLRPNAWGTAYTKPSTFHMYGGKIVSSDGGVRVASTSSDSYKDVAAVFIMDGGSIDAAFDGIFIQQSNAAYDTLSVELNGGTVAGGKYPIRFYGPDATSVNSGAAKPMTLTINSGADVVTLSDFDTSKTWYVEGQIAYGGGTTLDNLNTYTTIQIN